MADPGAQVDIRPAAAQDMDEFYAAQAYKPRETCRAWSVWLDGALVGIAGVAFCRTTIVAFSDFTLEALHISRRVILRAALRLWDNIRALGYSVIYAVAAPHLAGAPALLKRLGFVHVESSARGEVFQWVS